MQHTLLLLHGNGDLIGAAGETPVVWPPAMGFTTGIFGQGIDLPTGARLRYAAAGNALATAGTVEFWLRPHWQGDDGQDHMAFSWGTTGGSCLARTAATTGASSSTATGPAASRSAAPA